MKVIGLLGLIGSGKDVVATYLAEKYGYEIISMGDIVREIATRMGRTHNRDDLQLTQKEMVEKHGWEYFAEKVVVKIVVKRWQKVVVNGIRRPNDVIVPKRHFGKEMTVVLVDVSARKRYDRLKNRKRIGDPENFEEFNRQEKNEIRLFNFDETVKYKEDVIDNSNDLEHLYKNVDNFVKKHKLD